MLRTVSIFLLAVSLALPVASTANAGETEYLVRIKEHKFDPSEVRVPAGQKVKLVIRNEDKTDEEFESKQLRREKIVRGGQSVTILVGPLKPGRYAFFGEFHEDTAKGFVVAE